MDFPVHVAAGALAGNVLLYVHARQAGSSGELTQADTLKLGTAGCLFGVLTHLLLDAMPYYDWLFRVEIFKPLPQWWLFPPILTTLPVIVIVLYLNSDARIVAELSMLGGMYPDIEKLAYFDAGLPRFLVLFPFHSCRLSKSEWEFAHKHELIVMEICLFALIMGMIYWLAAERTRMQPSLCQSE